jgi:AraC family transcriptional regulator
MTTLHIKNMVCPRCIRTVRDELSALGYNICSVTLGKAVFDGMPDMNRIRARLEEHGFELLETTASKLIESIKTAIINRVRSEGSGAATDSTERVSEYLARVVGKDYDYLSTLFSSVETITIERYVILQKIEYVKELLLYDELTVSEIAYRLGYSSTSHVSRQFKDIVGMSPTEFKVLREHHRISLDRIGQ